jgi:hypothetical protein
MSRTRREPPHELDRSAAASREGLRSSIGVGWFTEQWLRVGDYPTRTDAISDAYEDQP